MEPALLLFSRALWQRGRPRPPVVARFPSARRLCPLASGGLTRRALSVLAPWTHYCVARASRDCPAGLRLCFARAGRRAPPRGSGPPSLLLVAPPSDAAPARAGPWSSPCSVLHAALVWRGRRTCASRAGADGPFDSTGATLRPRCMW